jgi:predicted type IV restriction endonuclease
MSPKLDIPEYLLKSKATDRGEELFDPVRGKYVSSQPEEIVRQRIIQYLNRELGWPLSLMRSEHGIKLNGQSKRVDLSLHDSSGLPIMIVECKAPSVSIDQRTFEQAARYNIVMKVPYLLLTNGLLHFCCKVDHDTGKVRIVDQLPLYTSMPVSK